VETVAITAAVLFAVVNGLNDGGALLGVAAQLPGVRPLTALLGVTAAVAVVPLVVGTAVAATLADRLVRFDGPGGQVALLVAITVAVVVSTVLARLGLPTSLTLALVGAIAGAGLGAALPVAWPTVALVLALAAIAPLVGGGVGWLLIRLAASAPRRAPLDRRVRRWHRVGFTAQCLAYGANDGQKMLAVLAVTSGTVASGVPLVGWQLAVAAGGFLVGAVLGVRRAAATLGGGITPVRPPEAATAEVAAATVVLGTAAVGSPVSMTQAVSGALVGTALRRGSGGIRWREAVRLAGAWAITLPTATGIAALVAAAARSSLGPIP
jgi:inorganic phosphate transporter, PiT family